MSFRILGSVMCISLFALATVTYAQNAPQTTSNPNVKVTQGTTQPGPAEAPAKTSKSKVKKAKGGKGTASGGPESRRPRPQEARGLQIPECTNNAPAEAALLGSFFHSVHFWHSADIASAPHMSATGPKRTLPDALHMSAFGGKADMGWRTANVCF